ncbi:malate dehydrogenase [Cellvibrio sp. BR]|uniref:Ldh family oxidoreductase n=1 Tax=Cellvibrio sp. BR TaxID=1134474 RepID=UPI00026008EB|nr:Ldh family oxidoreductase [Cellvibrio sp. BR]EIK44207.1 malate dehydrogenase [Cellvibrio sp. BR]
MLHAIRTSDRERESNRAPSMHSVIRVNHSQLCQAICQRLQQAGVNTHQARIEAEIMVEADLLGTPSHGVRMLPNLLAALASGQVSATATPHKVSELGAISIVDCGNGTGRYASATAMDQAVSQASQFGAGVCLAKNTSHWGRAHAYASRAAQQGFIGLCTTNAIPTMAAWGAKTRVIGNNPIAIGIPGVSQGEPIVLDMAMSQAAVGKIATMHREGQANTEHLGLDRHGKATADPAAILEGAVTPMGQHKGAGLALMFELLTAALAGAQFGYQLGASGTNSVDSAATKIFIALNINAFIEPDMFKNKVAQLLHQLTSEATPFNYPSERGWKDKKNNLINGVPLHQKIVKELLAVGVDIAA